MVIFQLIFQYMIGVGTGLTQFLDGVYQAIDRLGVAADLKTEVFLIPIWLFIVAAGFFSYRLIRFNMAILSAFFGYFAGASLLPMLGVCARTSWGCYALGATVAVLVGILAYTKASYVWGGVMFVLGYCTLMTVLLTATPVAGLTPMAIPLICAVGGVVLALLSIAMFRLFCIVGSSLICSVLSISLLSNLFPKVEILQFGQGKALEWIFVGALFALFAVCQFLLGRRRFEEDDELID